MERVWGPESGVGLCSRDGCTTKKGRVSRTSNEFARPREAVGRGTRLGSGVWGPGSGGGLCSRDGCTTKKGRVSRTSNEFARPRKAVGRGTPASRAARALRRTVLFGNHHIGDGVGAGFWAGVFACDDEVEVIIVLARGLQVEEEGRRFCVLVGVAVEVFQVVGHVVLLVAAPTLGS